MSGGAALVRFHDWRAHGLVAVPVSIGWPPWCWRSGMSCFCTWRLTKAGDPGRGPRFKIRYIADS